MKIQWCHQDLAVSHCSTILTMRLLSLGWQDSSHIAIQAGKRANKMGINMCNENLPLKMLFPENSTHLIPSYINSLEWSYKASPNCKFSWKVTFLAGLVASKSKIEGCLQGRRERLYIQIISVFSLDARIRRQWWRYEMFS